MSDMMWILAMVAGALAVILLCMYVQSRVIRKGLASLLTRLSRGERVQVNDFEFIDGARLEQMQYPFTALDGQLIAQARELRREELEVTLTKPMQAVFGDYEYHIRGRFEGLDAHGLPFALDREGYVCITCNMYRGHLLPCITDIHTGKRSAWD